MWIFEFFVKIKEIVLLLSGQPRKALELMPPADFRIFCGDVPYISLKIRMKTL